jgi:hypothetical protein
MTYRLTEVIPTGRGRLKVTITIDGKSKVYIPSYYRRHHRTVGVACDPSAGVFRLSYPGSFKINTNGYISAVGFGDIMPRGTYRYDQGDDIFVLTENNHGKEGGLTP